MHGPKLGAASVWRAEEVGGVRVSEGGHPLGGGAVVLSTTTVVPSSETLVIWTDVLGSGSDRAKARGQEHTQCTLLTVLVQFTDVYRYPIKGVARLAREWYRTICD